MASGLPLYISVAQLTEQVGRPYAWGIFDIYPSADVGRAPMLWGIAQDAAQLSTIAARYGLAGRLKLAPSHDINASVTRRANYRRPLAVAHKGTFACWRYWIDWLSHRPPERLETGLSPADLSSLATQYCQQHGIGLATTCHLKNHQLAARAQQAHQPKAATSAVGLIYSSAGRRSPSQAHLITDTSPSHITVDLLPFYSGGFLLQGWAGLALYTAKLSRAELDACGMAKHKPTGRTFYMAEQAHQFPRHAGHRHQLDDDLEHDDLDRQDHHHLIALPASSLQWALETLSIAAWPTSPSELKQACRSALQRAHPDKGGSTELFMQAKAAHAYLSSLLQASL